MKFELNEIVEALSDEIVEMWSRDSSSHVYDSAVFDSRECVEGNIFIAIDGEKATGISFVEDAILNGAVCVVANAKYREAIAQTYDKFKDSVDFVFVKDSLLFFGRLGQIARNKFEGHVVGVIGSVGKTTTKNMLRELGGGQELAHASRGSFNNQTGVPLTLCAISETAKCAIVELGESHFGDLTYITNFAQPTILVITNVQDAHTQYLGDTLGVAKTMNESVSLMNHDGVVLAPATLNYRNEVLNGCKSHIVYVVDETQGEKIPRTGQETEIAQIVSVTNRADLTHDFTLRFRGNEINLHIPLVGRHFVIDAALAVAASIVCGVPTHVLSERLNNVRPQGHRMRIVESGLFTIVDDCYNANPASMKASMDAVAGLAKSASRRSVFFMGPMRELGENSDSFHSQLGEYAQEIGIDVLVCVDAATKPAFEKEIHTNAYYFESVQKCCDELASIVKIGDIIGVKASRGPDPAEPALYPLVRKLTEMSALT